MLPLTRDDAAFIVECTQILRTESPSYAFVDDDPEYVHQNIQTMFDAGSAFGFKDDHNTGFLLGAISASWYSKVPHAYEQLLYVIPASRGGMLAARLIRAFEREAFSRRARRVYVGATTDMDDERTISMYQRLGYTRKGMSLYKENPQNV